MVGETAARAFQPASGYRARPVCGSVIDGIGPISTLIAVYLFPREAF